eukprot:scaffold16092_cov127-Isochrysis_galbana.AAC.4
MRSSRSGSRSSTRTRWTRSWTRSTQRNPRSRPRSESVTKRCGCWSASSFGPTRLLVWTPCGVLAANGMRRAYNAVDGRGCAGRPGRQNHRVSWLGARGTAAPIYIPRGDVDIRGIAGRYRCRCVVR